MVVNAQLPAQRGISFVIKEGFEPETALWPEAPGYGFGTAKDIVLIASLTNREELLGNPILGRAILAQSELIYPNGLSIGLGDTTNTRINTSALELLITTARKRGDAELEARLTAAVNREIESGNYDRNSQFNIVALTKYVPDLKPTSAALASSRTFFGKPLDVLMQNNPGADIDHSLAAAMYGTEGGHIHANGLAIELYGAGVILGAPIPGAARATGNPITPTITLNHRRTTR